MTRLRVLVTDADTPKGLIGWVFVRETPEGRWPCWLSGTVVIGRAPSLVGFDARIQAGDLGQAA